MAKKATKRQVCNRLKQGRLRIKAGWCKNEYMKTRKDGTKLYCALGALGTTTPGGAFADIRLQARIALQWAMGDDLIAKYGMRVAVFNDADTTKKKDVIALYDRAIAEVCKA